MRVPAGQPAPGPLSTKSAPLVRRRRGTLRAAAWITEPSRSSTASAAAPDTTRRECARRRAGSGLRHSIMPSRAVPLALVPRVGFAWLPLRAAHTCVHARAQARLRCEGTPQATTSRSGARFCRRALGRGLCGVGTTRSKRRVCSSCACTADHADGMPCASAVPAHVTFCVWWVGRAGL